MNIGLLIPVPATPQAASSSQHATGGQDFLTQVLQGRSENEGDLTDPSRSAESSQQETAELKVPEIRLLAVENPIDTASKLTDAIPSTAQVQIGPMQLNELYPQHWLATGHLSYKVQSAQGVIAGSTASAGSVADRHMANEGDHSVAGSFNEVQSADVGDVDPQFITLHRNSIRQAERDTRAADLWQRSVTQAIADSLEPWLKRRISVQISADTTSITIRDYAASNAENAQVLESLLAKLEPHKPTTMRITINGQDVASMSPKQPHVTENRYAR